MTAPADLVWQPDLLKTSIPIVLGFSTCEEVPGEITLEQLGTAKIPSYVSDRLVDLRGKTPVQSVSDILNCSTSNIFLL